MKIVFCVDSMDSGGAERVVANLSNYLVGIGNAVSIIMVSTSVNQSFYQLNENIKLTALCLGYKKKVNPIKRVKLLRKVIKTEAPDVVISFLPHVNVYTSWALKGCKIPHVVSERNNPYTDPKGKILRWLKERAFKKADGAVFQTTQAFEYYKGKCKGKQKQKIIFNPLVLSWTPDNYDFTRDKKIISVGRLQKQKNFTLLIKAFKLFYTVNSDYVLEIYGEGAERQTLTEFVCQEKLVDVVKFMGNRTDWQKEAYKASMFVLSSDYEGMPNALLEAMAIGVPSISTDCPIGGPREIIRDGENGFLIPIGDEQKLVEKMNVLVSDEKTSISFSQNGRRLIEQLSIEKIGNQWLELIMELTQ